CYFSAVKLLSRLEALQSKIRTLRSLATPEAIQFVEDQLRHENGALELKIEHIRQNIVNKELVFGVFQYRIPARKAPEAVSGEPGESLEPKLSANQEAVTETTTPAPKAATVKTKTKLERGGEGKGVTKRVANGNAQSRTDGEGPVDVGRLDMRVGRIVEVERHPNADSLYVEKVDLGEGRLRTVVSGLVKFVPIEALQNRVGIFLCNLKPVKMRDVESEAMLMCASAPESDGVEPLTIDSDSVALGDSVVVPGYTHNPDDQLKPKKKVFEQVKPDLRVNENGFATYKGACWTLKNTPTAFIKAEKLRGVPIA
ncbi:Aminoacyl tRNA synthase complex interacting, partial [Fasciolopsis buskii]